MVVDESQFEILSEKLYAIIRRLKFPIVSAIVSGLLAYMFCFTNRFEIMDDLGNYFSTGSGLSSGRWGLELIDALFPPVSIPWLNGIVSLILLTTLSCIVVEMFSVRKPVMQIALAAVLVTFPSQTCTFAYMFISSWYAFSLLLAVISAYLMTQAKEIKQFVLPVVLLVLSLSIYQAYLAVTVSFLIVFAFRMALMPDYTAKEILKRGITWIAAIAVSTVVYYGINFAAMNITGTSFNSYAENNLSSGGILWSIRVAYTSFAGYFIKGYYDVISSRFSLVIHALMFLCSTLLVFLHFKQNRENNGKLVIAILCLLLLPLGVNCLRIVSSLFHNLMIFGFTSVYILAATIVETCLDSLKEKLSFWGRDAVCICLLIIACINISYANRVYMKMFMQFEQAQSFYSSVISCLNQHPEFTKDSPVAFVGTGDAIYDIPAIDTEKLAGVQLGIIGTYSQGEFIKYFCGLELNVAGWDDTDVLAEDDRVIAMPSFPSYGSIRKIDDFFVVKID